MSKILRNEPIKLAQCQRCKGYVFLAMVGGMKAMADPAPLDITAYTQALIAGVKTYRLVEQAGRPHRLEFDTPSVPSKLPRVSAHDCGAIARDAIETALEVPQGPRSAPAMPGSNSGGLRPPAARAGAQTPTQASSSAGSRRRSAARHATGLPSSPCDGCGLPFKPGDLYSAIEWPPGYYRWAAHKVCTEPF